MKEEKRKRPNVLEIKGKEQLVTKRNHKIYRNIKKINFKFLLLPN